MLNMDYPIVLLPKPPIMGKTGIKCQPRRLRMFVASRCDNEHTRSTSVHNQVMIRQFRCIWGFEVTGGHSSVCAFLAYFGKWTKAVFVAQIGWRFVFDLRQIIVFHFSWFCTLDKASGPISLILLLSCCLAVLNTWELFNAQVVRPLSVM